jgi:hypothetical protein
VQRVEVAALWAHREREGEREREREREREEREAREETRTVQSQLHRPVGVEAAVSPATAVGTEQSARRRFLFLFFAIQASGASGAT